MLFEILLDFNYIKLCIFTHLGGLRLPLYPVFAQKMVLKKYWNKIHPLNVNLLSLEILNQALLTIPLFYRVPQSTFAANRPRGSWVKSGQYKTDTQRLLLYVDTRYQGCNVRKVNCSFVYSAYILKPVLSGRNL